MRQVGSQRDLYERPADRFVAGFVGRSTFLEGALEAPGRFRTDGGLVIACRKPIQVGVRAPRPFVGECLSEPVRFREGQADAAA